MAESTKFQKYQYFQSYPQVNLCLTHSWVMSVDWQPLVQRSYKKTVEEL